MNAQVRSIMDKLFPNKEYYIVMRPWKYFFIVSDFSENIRQLPKKCHQNLAEKQQNSLKKSTERARARGRKGARARGREGARARGRPAVDEYWTRTSLAKFGADSIHFIQSNPYTFIDEVWTTTSTTVMNASHVNNPMTAITTPIYSKEDNWTKLYTSRRRLPQSSGAACATRHIIRTLTYTAVQRLNTNSTKVIIDWIRFVVSSRRVAFSRTIGSRTSQRHNGHRKSFSSHPSMQAAWKWWPHLAFTGWPEKISNLRIQIEIAF